MMHSVQNWQADINKSDLNKSTASQVSQNQNENIKNTSMLD